MQVVATLENGDHGVQTLSGTLGVIIVGNPQEGPEGVGLAVETITTGPMDADEFATLIAGFLTQIDQQYDREIVRSAVTRYLEFSGQCEEIEEGFSKAVAYHAAIRLKQRRQKARRGGAK